MSKEVQALVLASGAEKISSYIPQLTVDYVEKDMRRLHDEDFLAKIGTERFNNILAGHLIANLGSLTFKHLLGRPVSEDGLANPFTAKLEETLNEVSPFSDGENLSSLAREDYGIELSDSPACMAGFMEAAIAPYPVRIAEMQSSFGATVDIIKQRGTVVMPTYSIEESIEGIGELDKTIIAPEGIRVLAGDRLMEIHNARDFLTRIRPDVHQIHIPYYAAARLDNMSYVLDSAMEDMLAIGQAIKS